MAAPQLAPTGKKLKKKKPRNKPILEPEAKDSLQGSALLRALGSPDNDTRKRGLNLLTSWLESHENVSEYDMLRLWKGLYYCFWHSDLITVQTALAERLADLVVDLSPKVALSYFQGFVLTMKREWSSIDQHRMNKYLVFVRKMYAGTLRRLEQSKWDPEVVEEYCAVLRDDVLLMPTANDLGAGFAYFVCDIAVEEMVKAGEAAGAGKKRLTGETVVALLQPFLEGMVATKNKLLLKRLYSGVFSEVARHVDEQLTPFDAVDSVAFAEELFERGSKKETRATNRKYIYQASSELEAAGKKHAAARVKGVGKATKETKMETPVVTKKTENNRKKRKDVEAFDSSLEASEADADTVPVSSGSKKKKKKKRTSMNGTEAGEEKTEKTLKVKKAETAKETEKVEKTKKSKKADTLAMAAETAREATRKSVRINLKKNLVRTIGEKPYPEDVRTPPTSKPRGSALKVTGRERKKAKRSLRM